MGKQTTDTIDGPRQVRTYRRNTTNAGSARAAARAVLEAWHIHGEQADDVALVVSELIGNASRHTLGPVVILTLTLAETAVLVEVFDGGSVLPDSQASADDAESGRGLLMVAAVSVHSGAHLEGTGKIMWAEVLCTPDSAIVIGEAGRKPPSQRTAM